MSKIDKHDFVKSHLASRMIIRKRILYLRDYNAMTDSIVLRIAMFSKLRNLLELKVTVDAEGYVSVMFDLDAWENYLTGKFTGDEAAKKGWHNLINHVPTNSIMLAIDKYPTNAKEELGKDEIQNRLKAKDFNWPV